MIAEANSASHAPPSSEHYRTVIGCVSDPATGRVPFGPLRAAYFQPAGAPVAPLPPHLRGPHVTVFGPPDTHASVRTLLHSARDATLPGEPAIVAQLVEACAFAPKVRLIKAR